MTHRFGVPHEANKRHRMTTTLTPDSRVWLLREVRPLGPFVTRLDGDRDGSSFDPGDWVVEVDVAGAFKRVGRILRIRAEIESTTLHFDRLHVVKKVRSLAEIGLATPTSLVSRLRPEDIAIVLAGDGISHEEIPLIQDARYIRDLLEIAVHDDLLGPAGGPREFIKDTSVRDRYLLGKLAPPQPDLELGGIEPASGGESPEEPSETELPAPTHEPGAEFVRATGRVTPEDDALDEIDTSNNQSIVPSSMGFTFCVAPDADEIEVDVRWGRYERVPNDEHDVTRERTDKKTGQRVAMKVRVWQRQPCGGVFNLPLRDGQVAPVAPDAHEPGVRVQGAVRTNAQGERLVTLFLVNAQKEPGVNKDTAWLFQPEIIVRAPGQATEKAIFRRRPSNEVVVDDEERDRLALAYRNRIEFAVGHGVSVHAETDPDDPTRAVEVRTAVMPRYEVPVTDTPGLHERDRPALRTLVEKGWLDMTRLAEMDTAELLEALGTLTTDYKTWIDEQRARIGTEIEGRSEEDAMRIVGLCADAQRRLEDGVAVLLKDPKALAAFRFANRAMAAQRVRSIYALARRRGQDVEVDTLDVRANRSWRSFQLSFLLLSIPSLADPTHRDRTKPLEAFADLLWFPTGGGKTEAYLGVAAFAIGIRRLQKGLGGYDGSRGLAVIMRYTLRLLTLQQFQRASSLICAMETIRREDVKTWGKEPFTLGLWVGNKVTPGSTERAHTAVEALRSGDRNLAGIESPAQLTSCPWCGSEISPRRDIVVDRELRRTSIFCGDPRGDCDFSKSRSSAAAHVGLPVKVVDEELYHRPPSMLIATVDKFAQMAWKNEVRTLFGHVSQECPRHGLLWPSHECGTGHTKKGRYPAVRVSPVRGIRPPDLIIQDEFHLISGPLGTMVGLYETAVDELCTWALGEERVRPKVVASTATVRRAAEQVRGVFMRNIAVFPPSGLDIEDNFFSVVRPTSERAGRRYIGICAPGSSRPAVLIRTYTAFLTAAQALADHFGPVADPYMTLIGYFNSLRELGGMKRLAEDDVQTRAYRVAMSLVERPGLAQREVKEIRELTSRISSQDIPKYLDEMEIRYAATYDAAEDRWMFDRQTKVARHLDVVLATNMLSVGVDVNRLGLMVVNGQPKGTAEYIQATSRVGRAFPGIVASVLTWARPRDLSHYETYEHYHATFYQHVEAQSVTPYSPRALDRGLTGCMISLMRNRFELFAPNEGAGRMDSPSRSEVLEVTSKIEERVWRVTEDAGKKGLATGALRKRADEWAAEASLGGRMLVYQRRGQSSTSVPLLRAPGASTWNLWTVPMSMREVEPGVRLILEEDRSMDEPEWQARVAREPEDE